MRFDRFRLIGAALFLIIINPWPVLKAEPLKDNHLILAIKDNTIIQYSAELKTQTTIYPLKQKYIFDNKLTVSPSDTLFAFVDKKQGEFLPGKSSGIGVYDIMPEINIRIMNKNAKLLDSLSNSFSYAWSPAGDMIAFIIHDLRDADLTYEHPTAIWVYNLADRKTQAIANIPVQNLSWGKFDNCLYYSDWDKVYKWNPVTGIIDRTTFKDIHFSPDGKYYLKIPLPEDDFPTSLFETKSNKELPNSFPNNIGSLSYWVGNTGHSLLYIKRDVVTEAEGTGKVKRIISQKITSETNYIYDVEKREVVKQFDGIIGSWVGNRDQIIVERNGKIEFEDIPK